MARYHDTKPVSGWTGHIPGAKWQIGSRRSDEMSALNSILKQPTSVFPQTAQNNSTMGQSRPNEMPMNGQLQPLPNLQMMARNPSMIGPSSTGFPSGLSQGQYPMYGPFGSTQGLQTRFLPQISQSPISPQAMQSIQNYAGSLAQSGQALANSAQALAQQVQNVQNYASLVQSSSNESAFPGNPPQPFLSSNPTLGLDGMVGNGVPMPYPNDSQISQFGFNSQGMPVRIPSDVQKQYQQQQRIQNADGSYTVITTTKRGKGTSHGQNGDLRQAREQVRTSASEAQRRSKSVPRKVEKDAFEGLDGGLYTKGEVARNRERREMAMKGIPIQGGDWKSTSTNRLRDGGGVSAAGVRDGVERASRRVPRDATRDGQRGERVGGFDGNGYGGSGGAQDGDGGGLDGSLGASFRNRNYLEEEEEDQVPAAGYSGHIPAYKRISVGKNFHTAALEAKKEYIKNRYGDREASEILNPNRSVAFDESQDWLNPQMQSLNISSVPGGGNSFNNPHHNVGKKPSQYNEYVNQAGRQGENYANQGFHQSRSMNNLQQFQQFQNLQQSGYPHQNLPY
ncbi:unnamed protein product, partial [Mesorhabditis belari]|uniref:Uncharacterized protein n=1 Tax=Mesorhabditis belari TaxID=2138241 RepID=A0AAF3FKB8_9BILA